MNTTNTGKKIKIARIEKDLTQEELAFRLGISTSALSQYESGKRVPRDSMKIKIAEFCGTSVESLFFAHQPHDS